MKIKALHSTNRMTLASLVVLSISMTACGGGGSGSSAASEATNDPEIPSTPADGDIDTTGLPDFSILNLTSSATLSPLSALQVQATIINNGDAAAVVPDAWFNFSKETEDNNNFQRTRVSMVPVGNQSAFLQPGESGLFEATNERAGLVDIQIRRSGTHYARLWLNPDLSTRFLNPEDSVVASYDLAESDYENNKSELITFESNTTNTCEADAFEQNDSDEEATELTTNVIFETNACDEAFEIFAIDLTAGVTYELIQHVGERTRIWNFTVISPSQEYLRRNVQTALITPEVSGRYLISASTGATPNSQLLLEVIE